MIDEANAFMTKRSRMETCQAVCVALGPYRNLTTLTAATLFLHSNCQVLNHAGGRIFGTRYDFLSAYSKKKLDDFIQYAIEISEGGERGLVGGSITHSHAFDDQYGMRGIFEKTGMTLAKDEITGLFWKESHRASNHIRLNTIDLADILARDSRLRFLMPIRNPLDCAASNLKIGYAHHFPGLQSPGVVELALAILDEIHRFMSWKEIFPDRFFYFFEHSISRTMLEGLAKFMCLKHDEDWLGAAMEAMVVKSRYVHDTASIERYRDAVVRKFAQYADISEQLLAYR